MQKRNRDKDWRLSLDKKSTYCNNGRTLLNNRYFTVFQLVYWIEREREEVFISYCNLLVCL